MNVRACSRNVRRNGSFPKLYAGHVQWAPEKHVQEKREREREEDLEGKKEETDRCRQGVLASKRLFQGRRGEASSRYIYYKTQREPRLTKNARCTPQKSSRQGQGE